MCYLHAFGRSLSFFRWPNCVKRPVKQFFSGQTTRSSGPFVWAQELTIVEDCGMGESSDESCDEVAHSQRLHQGMDLDQFEGIFFAANSILSSGRVRANGQPWSKMQDEAMHGSRHPFW